MDVAAYLRRANENLSKETRLVKDFSVFDFDYVPQEPLLRDEGKKLITELMRFQHTGIPTHHFVIGSRGSGKTLTVRLLERIVPQETSMQVRYANCRQHNTSFKILAHLLGVPPRGVSLAELFDAFSAKTTEKTAVILDEVELMSPKDRRKEIFYLLSRSSKPFMVVALSNNARVERELDLATRSSLQAVPLHFRNYDAEQIRLILEDRARQGLHRWDPARLAAIAALTVQRTNADARVAIKTLYYLTVEPQEALERAFERARRDVVVDMIADLSATTLATLWAVASARDNFAREIYGRYRRFCQARGDKPISYVHFSSNLSYLQSAGLVALVSTRVGRTYPNRVELTTERSVVEQIFRLRFEG